jgi:hypothetical protein
MTRSVTYRKYAQACLAMIESVQGQQEKSSLLTMAQCWHRLATEAEQAERADVVWAPAPGEEASH